MNKELEIKLKISDQEAKRSVAAQIAGLKKVEEAAARSAIATERAANKAAAAGVAAAKKKVDAALKAANNAAEAQVKATNRALDAEVRATERRNREVLKAAQTAIKAAEKAAEAQIRADMKAASSAVAAQQKRANAATKAADSEKGSASAIEGLVGAATKLGGVFAGLHVGAKVFNEIQSALMSANETAIKFAQNLLKTKDDLKELAALKGLAFADDETVKQITNFSKATGMAIPEADEFQKELFGSAAGGLDKGFVDQETLEKTAVLTGRSAKRQTRDYKTRGDVVGLLTQLHNYKVDKNGKAVSSDDAAKAIASDMEGVRLGLTEGRGDDAPLSRSFANVAGSLAGDGMVVPDAKKLAALIGVTSLSAGPGMADTRSEQLIRGLRGETVKQMDFMKQFTGRDEHDDLETQIDKFHVAMEKIQKTGRDPVEYLIENGVNSEQSKALIETNRNYNVLKARFRKAENPGNDAKLQADNEAFRNSPLGRKQFGEAQLAAAELEQGKKREALEVELPAARAELVNEGMGRDASWALGNSYRNAMSGWTVSGEDIRVQQRALEHLRKEAGMPELSPMEKDAGVPIDPAAGYAEMAAIPGKAEDAARYYKEIIDLNRKIVEQNAAILAEAKKKNEPKGLGQAPPAMWNKAGPPGGMQRP